LKKNDRVKFSNVFGNWTGKIKLIMNNPNGEKQIMIDIGGHKNYVTYPISRVKVISKNEVIKN